MSQKKTVNNECSPNKVCPVTGLRVLQEPEWTAVSFSKGCSVTISVIGGNILLIQPVGHATLEDAKGVVALSKRVIRNAIPGNRPYIQIDDYSNLKSTSIKARKYYIVSMQEPGRLAGLIFCGTSFLLKMSIKLAKEYHPVSFDVKIVKDYKDAARLAQKLFEDGQSGFDVSHTNAVSHPTAVSNEDTPYPETVTNPVWRIGDENFSLKFEILKKNILHGVTTGRLASEHIAPALKLQEKIVETIFSSAMPYYYILGTDKSKGTSQKTRKLYHDAILALYKKYPFRIFIFYGVNRLLKAGISLYRPFVPFKIEIVKDMDSALKLIADEVTEAKVSIKKPSDPDRTKQYVNELLQRIGYINWETGSIHGIEGADPSHPFFQVFEAIDLLKWELDDLFQKHRQTMEKLQKAYEKLKSTQAQLVQSSKLASIGELASGVAHELNQPLMVIRGNAQLTLRTIRKGNLDVDDLAKQSEVINRNTKRMMNIINHLRTFSRQSKSDFELVDINKIIKDSFLMMSEQIRLCGIEIKKDLGADLPKIKGDTNQLEQVFLNLITNARDAIEARGDGRRTDDEGRSIKDNFNSGRNEYRGKLEIITRTGETNNPRPRPGQRRSDDGKMEMEGQHKQDNIQITSRRGGQQARNFVEILIRDNGGGISTKSIEKIFYPFFTTKEVGKGTGLGLSISYSIIKDHDGEIKVAETGPQGTVFRIRLPELGIEDSDVKGKGNESKKTARKKK